jgi:murein L,D-transpeptidase YcbB/YkuD
VTVWSCLIALLAAGACRRSDDGTGQEIRSIVSAEKPPTYLEGVGWKLVSQIYQDREYRPLWIGARGLTETAKELIASLCDAEREGLRSADYRLGELRGTVERLRPSLDKQRPEAFAVLDLELTRRFLEYGSDLLTGRLDPTAVASEWYIRERRSSTDSTLRAAVQAEAFDDKVAPLRPRQVGYAQLVKALAEHREILRQGGWPEVPGGTTLRRGDRGARVAALRRRLWTTGDLEGSPKGEPVFDREVAGAVARFQERHGMASDGIVGAATLNALNVPVEVRMRQIQLNLERYRWLPTEFGSRYIYVNIPDYQLSAYDRGKQVLQMRAVVGEEYENATPVFADSMTFLVFRPAWNVPPRVLAREIIPALRKRRSYLVRNDLEVLDAGPDSLVLNPRRINWRRVDASKIRVRQKGGSPTNPLGLVKFMFPNQFAVYLHDTPTPEAFDRPKRTLSHGCVWVEKPVELADYVLAGQDDWDEKKIRETMKTVPADEEERVVGQKVTLERPVPVYIVYLTAFIREGELNFRRDPYGKAREAVARLGELSPSDPRPCEELLRVLTSRDPDSLRSAATGSSLTALRAEDRSRGSIARATPNMLMRPMPSPIAPSRAPSPNMSLRARAPGGREWPRPGTRPRSATPPDRRR